MFKWLTARRERREQFRRALMERVRAANFAPTVTVDDVLRIIRRDFPNEICNEIFAELSAYGPAQRHFELHRVHAAILKLSRGQRGRIGQFLHSDQDFRDVLTLAEIPSIAKTMLSLQEFVERPIDEIEGITQRDRDQYLKWFNGKDAS